MEERKDPNYNYGGHHNMGYGQPPPYPSAYQSPYPPQSTPYAPASAPAQQSQQSTTTVVVQQPGIQTHPAMIVGAAPADNMGLAIFACLCCFWPLGIVAILRANSSQSALARGDIAGAMTAGADARKFSLISIGIGVFLIILIIILSIAIPVASYKSRTTYYYG